jgi:hypothetical protein
VLDAPYLKPASSRSMVERGRYAVGRHAAGAQLGEFPSDRPRLTCRSRRANEGRRAGRNLRQVQHGRAPRRRVRGPSPSPFRNRSPSRALASPWCLRRSERKPESSQQLAPVAATTASLRVSPCSGASSWSGGQDPTDRPVGGNGQVKGARIAGLQVVARRDPGRSRSTTHGAMQVCASLRGSQWAVQGSNLRPPACKFGVVGCGWLQMASRGAYPPY